MCSARFVCPRNVVRVRWWMRVGPYAVVSVTATVTVRAKMVPVSRTSSTLTRADRLGSQTSDPQTAKPRKGRGNLRSLVGCVRCVTVVGVGSQLSDRTEALSKPNGNELTIGGGARALPT